MRSKLCDRHTVIVNLCMCNNFLPDAHRKSGFIQTIVQPLGTSMKMTQKKATTLNS